MVTAVGGASQQGIDERAPGIITGRLTIVARAAESDGGGETAEAATDDGHVEGAPGGSDGGHVAEERWY